MDYLLNVKLTKEGVEEFGIDKLALMCSRPHGINMGFLFYEVEGVQYGLPIKFIKEINFVTEKMKEVDKAIAVSNCMDPKCPVHGNSKNI